MSLRLLFLTQTYPRFEGDTAGPFIRDLARGLVALGDQVTVLTPHAPDVAAAWRDGGVEVVSFRYAPPAWEVLGYSRSLDADERIRPAAGLVAPLYALALRRSAARLVAPGGFDLVHAHWVVPNGVLASGLAGRLPLAIGLHGSDVFLAERPGMRALVAHALRRTRLLTGCSPELVERVCALGFDRARSRVIPYGVDVETFAPGTPRGAAWRQRLGIPADSVMLLAVGRMVTKKGFHVLLEVLPTLLAARPEVHVVLAGGGDLLADLRRRAAAHQRVHFPGPVYRDTLPDLYRAADLFVLPAVHDAKGNVDGLPNVILEAMASGLPVVASGISGIPLAVADGEQGLLVPERDAPALLTALERLVADGPLRRRLGAAARRRALAELTWEAVASRYQAAYREALGRSG